MRHKTLLVRLPYEDYTAVVDRAIAHDRYPDQELRVIVRAGLAAADPGRPVAIPIPGGETRASIEAARPVAP